MSFVGDVIGSLTGSDAADASRSAAATSAEAQREALQYLREREAIPQQFREQALTALGGLYGLPGIAPQATAQGGQQAAQQLSQPMPAQGGQGQQLSPVDQVMSQFPFLGLHSSQRRPSVNDIPVVAAQQQAQEVAPMQQESMQPSQQDLISSLMSSPVYRAALGDIGSQEEAILRNQAATGAIRSSGTEQMLAENQRQRQYGALQAALGGIQGLAGLPSYAPQIAQGMAGVGQTLAQGQIAGAQAQQQGIGNTLGLGLNALSLAGFSDIRLKTNIQPAGVRYGQAWFTWDWNEKAGNLGLQGKSEGVIADLVKLTRPDIVGMRDGYMTVNYQELANG